MENPFSWQHGASPSERKVSWRLGRGDGGRRGAEAVLGADRRAPSTGRAPAGTTERCSRCAAAPPPRGAGSANGFRPSPFLFYSHPGQSLETRSGTFTRMSCCLPKTSVSGAQAAGRGNPDIRLRQPERVAQRSKTPGAARGDWWEGVASQAEVAESEIRRPRSVVPFPQPRGKMGNQKNSVNPKCEKIQKPRLLAP